MSITFTTGQRPDGATHGIDDGTEIHWTTAHSASRWQVAMAFLATMTEPSACEIVVETLATEVSTAYTVSNGKAVSISEE